MSGGTFPSLSAVVTELRKDLEIKKCIILYAYNGTGKTRLSTEFKNAGKIDEDRDTLYFNAFTEDLFSWDNDIIDGTERILRFNSDSRFFSGIEELEIESRIFKFLQRYVDFNFKIDYKKSHVSFYRDESKPNIKVSRGEENIFIWCFFLAVLEMAFDEVEAYKWVKYVYIDDPISSLDENNAIAVANHLAQMIKKASNKFKFIISSHHILFFNVIYNELKNSIKYFLARDRASGEYILRDTRDTPTFHHVSLLVQLNNVAQAGDIYTYHFNMLRSVIEKTASFHGYDNFSDCIKQDADDMEGVLITRYINLLNHGDYSLYDPAMMGDDTKRYFKTILSNFMNRYNFNPVLFK